MSDLTNIEKRKFERLLGMGDGYVLDFSNRTFQEFVTDAVGGNIYDSKYDYGSGSKANRLRGFWQAEPNHVVGKLMDALLNHEREVEENQSISGLLYAEKSPEKRKQVSALRDQCCPN